MKKVSAQPSRPLPPKPKLTKLAKEAAIKAINQLVADRTTKLPPAAQPTRASTPVTPPAEATFKTRGDSALPIPNTHRMYVTSAPVLGSLGLKLKRHWQEYVPRTAAQLEREGRLDSHLYELQQQMLEQEATLIQQGLSPDQAREMTREIGFLPEED